MMILLFIHTVHVCGLTSAFAVSPDPSFPCLMFFELLSHQFAGVSPIIIMIIEMLSSL